MKILKKVLFILFGLMFVNAGLDKFLHYMPVPPLEPEIIKIGEAIMTLKWLLPLVAVVELLSGLLFFSSKTRLIGALMIFPVMIGIFIHNAVHMPSGLFIAAPLLLINLFVFYENRERLKFLLN